MNEAALLAVIVIGLLHGIEPAHGWPVAMFYATSKQRPGLHALASSAIMAAAHFTSSIFAVLVYVALTLVIPVSVPVLQYLKYAAAVVLIVLAIRFWMSSGEKAQHGHLHEESESVEHAHEHTHNGDEAHNHEHKHKAKVMTLAGLAGFAFVLGFAHEEEFALLALAVGGVNPLLLMVSYAVAVTVSLIGITILGVKAYRRFRQQMSSVERLAPKITSIILLILGGAFILGLA